MRNTGMRNAEEIWRLVDGRGGDYAAFGDRAPCESPIPPGVQPPLGMSKGAA